MTPHSKPRPTAYQLATTHNIAPPRCHNCHQTPASGLSWSYGYDDGTDPDYAGYQCHNCGSVQGLRRATIQRRIGASRQDRP